MIGHLRYILLVFFLMHWFQVSFASSEIDSILQRHKFFLHKAGTYKENVEEILNHFDKTRQRWDNISYDDAQKAGWKVPRHLENIRTLALNWSDTTSGWYRNSEVYNVMISSLDNWVQYKYQNPNWWHNEIGIPQLMRDILVLIKDDLAEVQLDKYLPILKQYKIAGSGANLIWSADLGMFYGLFTKDTALIKTAVHHMINEIKFSEKDGLKQDYSFQQHGSRLQMYQYGAAFLLDNIRIAWELRQTRWAYPHNKVQLLTSMLLEGWQWMARGIYTVPGTMDRSATRVDELNKADVRLYVEFFKDLVPSGSEALNALEARQNSIGKSLDGFRHFPYSDFTAYHKSDFSVFLKTISSRTLPSESINHENLKGKLMNSGETYFMRDGQEYFNMMPVWDWGKLPGITAFTGAHRMRRKDFNGAVSDEKIGFASMEYSLTSKDENNSVSCKKSWFFYDGYMLCLMSDVDMKNITQAYTILDQSRWRGTITTDKGIIRNGKYQEYLKWVRHNEFVYFPLDRFSDLHLYADTASGSWYTINNGYSADKITDSVFMPSIVHKPGNVSVAYVVAFSGKRSTNKVIRQQPFTIIKNDDRCQAVSFTDKSIAVAFYTPGSINLKDKTIHVDKACLLMIRNGKCFISDPLQKGSVVNIAYDKKKYQVQMNSNGSVVSFTM